MNRGTALVLSLVMCFFSVPVTPTHAMVTQRPVVLDTSSKGSQQPGVPADKVDTTAKQEVPADPNAGFMLSSAISTVNTPPVAKAASVTATEDAAKAISLGGTDANRNPLTYEIVSGPQHGTLVRNPAFPNDSKRYLFTPDKDYNGKDSFTFRAFDGKDYSNVATVSLTINAVNDAPEATLSSISTMQNTATTFALTGKDVDGQTAFTYTVTTYPKNGTLSYNATTKTWTYKPTTNVVGDNADSFQYKVYDGKLYSAVKTVWINITPSNVAPVVELNPNTPSLVNVKTLTVSYTSDGVTKTKTFPNLVEGVNALTITETNLAGLSTVKNFNVTVDSVAPVVVVDAKTPTLINMKTLTVSYTVDGVAKTKTFTNLLEGVNALTIAETDAAGNQKVVNLNVTVDTIAPVVVVDAKTPTLINTTSFTVSYTSDGVAKTVAFNDLSEGANALTITETDAAGNQKVVSLKVTVDTIAPVVVVDAKTPTLINTTSFTISYTSDGVAKTVAFNHLSEGANALTITETDLAGNTKVVTFSVLVTLPVIPPTDPTAYVAPIGIPAPVFGITQDVSMYKLAPGETCATNANKCFDFGDGQGLVPYRQTPTGEIYTHYIDNTTGDDTNNPYGTFEHPRKTLPTTVAAGSVLEIYGTYLVPKDSYVIGFNSDPNHPPTAQRPAFIRGSVGTVIGVSQEAIDAGVPARIEVGTNNLAYTIIENIHFERIPMGIAGHDTHDVVVRNSEFSGQNAAALGVTPSEPWAYDTPFTVDAASDVLTTYYAHEVHTGDAVKVGQWDSLPTGLEAGIPYYAIVLDGHSLKLATTQDNATKGIAIDLQGGSGSNPLSKYTVSDVHDIVFYKNLIHDTLLWNDTSHDWDYHGIGIDTYGRSETTRLQDVWVLDNTIYHVSGDGVQVNGNTAGNAGVSHIYIGGNTVHENRQSGLWVKQASDVIISQNTIYDMTVEGPGLSGAGMGFQYGPDKVWFLFNEVYNCSFGIRQSDTDGSLATASSAYIIGNYIHDLRQISTDDADVWGYNDSGFPSGWGIGLLHGGMNRYVVGNTLANVYGGILEIQAGPVYATDNIIYNIKPIEYDPAGFGAYRGAIEISGNNRGVDMSFTHNLIFGQGGSAQPATINWLGVTYATLTDAQANNADFSNNIAVNPLLDGSKLLAGSPAIGVAEPLTEIMVKDPRDPSKSISLAELFHSLYGVELPTNPDLGAVQSKPAPVMLPAPQEGKTGESLSVQVLQNGAQFTLDGNALPEGAVYHADTGNFTWTPTYNQAGVHVLQVVKDQKIYQMLLTVNYVPPVGVSTPEFGIMESYRMYDDPAKRPDSNHDGIPDLTYYQDAEGGFYTHYIDNTNGIDTNEDGTVNNGTIDHPRKTLPATVAAGSVIEIYGQYVIPLSGYNPQINNDPANPPTLAAPAFIRGVHNAEINATEELFAKTGNYLGFYIGAQNASYMIVENIRFNRIALVITTDHASVDPNAPQKLTHDIAIRNCEVTAAKSTLIGVGPSDLGKIHNVVVYNSNLHNTTDQYAWDDPTKDEDNHGMTVGTYGLQPGSEASNVWILDSQFSYLSGCGVQVNAQNTGVNAVNHVYIGRNIAHSNRQDGFGSKAATDVVISQNTIYDMRNYNPTNPAHGIAFQYGPDRLWIIENEIYDCNFGIMQTDTPSEASDYSVYIIGNYIHDLKQDKDISHWSSPEGWAISFWYGDEHRYVVGNTFANVYGGIEQIFPGPLTVADNIIYNLMTSNFPEEASYSAAFQISQWNQGVDIENNLIYGQAGGAYQSMINWMGYQYKTLADAQAPTGIAAVNAYWNDYYNTDVYSGKLENNIEADPLFTDPSHGDFTLHEGSPAIGAATPLTGIMTKDPMGNPISIAALFHQLYGINLPANPNLGAPTMPTELVMPTPIQ